MAALGYPLTAARIAQAMAGRLVGGDPQSIPKGFSIDSRSLSAGDLFFAIVAARDGHTFAHAALAQGASGVVVSQESAVTDRPDGAVVIAVADTTRALQALALHVRRASRATVVAITGSAGKTTTKEVTAELLGLRFDVVKNRGNLNNHLGLPLSLLELRHGADVAVMELGMNHAGEIRTLVGIAAPDVRVWTNVGDAHIGHFGSVEAIADAKAEILHGASARTLLVANADDSHVMARIAKFPGQTVTFGIDAPADVRATAVEDLGLGGTRAQLTTRHGAGELRVPLLGRGNLANVLASAAVALEMGVGIDDVLDHARSLQPSTHRGAVIRLGRNVTVVDDSYNSSPSALKCALEAVTSEKTATRVVAVLGEMRELGDLATTLHEQCGRAAAKLGLAQLVTVGGDAARAMGEAALAAGLAPGSVRHFSSSDAAADAVPALVQDGDVVLVKGSRGVRTDVVVDRLTVVLG